MAKVPLSDKPLLMGSTESRSDIGDRCDIRLATLLLHDAIKDVMMRAAAAEKRL
jgi:hypothetical protein